MRFFRLFPDCHLVRGPARSTIYCLTKGKWHHLSTTESKILDALTGSSAVEAVIADHGDAATQLLAMLVKEALGTYFEKPLFSEPYSPKSPMALRGIFEEPPVVQTLHLQITDECDAGCDFCGDGELIPRQGCNSCLRWTHRGGRRATPEDTSRLLEDLRELDVRAVVISGGNPLLEPERLLSLAAELRRARPGIGITVASSGGGMSDALGEAIKARGMTMSFSVFGSTPEEYGVVTGTPELHAQLLSAVAVCRAQGIAYQITLVRTPSARERCEDLYEFGVSLGGNDLSFTELLPRGDNLVKPRFRGGAPFGGDRGMVPSPTGPGKRTDVGVAEYFQRQKYGSCLNGRVAVALDGSVLPCPAWPKPVTNIGDKGLLSAFRVFTEESLVPYWETSKAKVPGCQSCESRLACNDCALLEWETHRDVEERRRYCDYLPEQGVWEERKS